MFVSSLCPSPKVQGGDIWEESPDRTLSYLGTLASMVGSLSGQIRQKNSNFPQLILMSCFASTTPPISSLFAGPHGLLPNEAEGEMGPMSQ